MNDDRWYYAGECFVILACCVALVLYAFGIIA